MTSFSNNKAGQIEAVCSVCKKKFDVGYERFHSSAFVSICFKHRVAKWPNPPQEKVA